MTEDIIDLFIDSLLVELKRVLGSDYKVEEREPRDTEVQAYQCWVATASFDDVLDYATAMNYTQVKTSIFVTTVYEVSLSTDHYRKIRHKRKNVLKAIRKSAILPLGDALILIGAEDTFLEENYFMSSYQITITYTEGSEPE